MRGGTRSFYKRGMRILGIDPGYGRLGLAIIDAEKGKKEILIYSECFETSPKIAHAERLSLIQEKIKKIIEEFSPEMAGIESLAFSKNKKTAIGVAEARGVILSEIAGKKIKITEHNPGQIKIAVTGHGASDKKQVATLVTKLIRLPHIPKHDDEYDAIAIGLTCFAHEHLDKKDLSTARQQ